LINIYLIGFFLKDTIHLEQAMMLTTGTRKFALAVGLTVVVVTTDYFVLDINTAALKNEAPTVLQRMDEVAYCASTRHMDTRGRLYF
jgi:hypothetical protein